MNSITTGAGRRFNRHSDDAGGNNKRMAICFTVPVAHPLPWNPHLFGSVKQIAMRLLSAWWERRDSNSSWSRLKAGCLVTRLRSRRSIFASRRIAFSVLPCAPAFLKRALPARARLRCCLHYDLPSLIAMPGAGSGPARGLTHSRELPPVAALRRPVWTVDRAAFESCDSCLVENARLELATLCLQSRRSPN